MKRKVLITLLLIINLIIVSKPSKSQIVSPFSIISGDYEINADEVLVDYSQKILKYNDRLHIALTNLDNKKISRFFLIEQEKYTSIFADIPIDFKVKDFSILGDSLYFCGYMNTVDTSFHKTTQGFIAYLSISDLFNNTGNLQCNYSRIPTTTIVKKIKTYHNNKGERMVAGIGSQFYSELPYERPVTPIDPPLIKDLPLSNWIYPDTNFFDCFIGYKITETVLNPAFPSVNPFSLYRHQYSQDLDTLQYRYEEFQDLVITDNYICLVSTYLFNPSQTGFIAHNKNIVLRKFDKEDFNNPISNYINLSSSDIGHGAYGFCLEALDNDNVAIAHVACEYPMGNEIRTIVTKVNLSEEPYQFIHSSLVDSDPDKTYTNMQDIEYIPEMDYLLLLRDKNINGINNILYYVDMDSRVFHNADTGFYTANYLFVPREIFPFQKWNNILKHNKTNFALIGNVGSKLGLLDNETNNFSINQCRTYDIKTIHQREINGFSQFANLFPCYFSLMYPYAPGFYYYGNTTIIHKMDLLKPRIEKIEDKCIEKSVN